MSETTWTTLKPQLRNRTQWDMVVVGPFPGLYPVYVAFKWVHRLFFLFVALLTLYFFYRVATASRIHKNFRLVLCTTAFSLLFCSFTRLVIHLILDLTNDVRDRYLVNLICLSLSHLHSITTVSSSLCSNMLAVEQHLAYIWVESYETQSTKVGLILIGVVVAQAVPFGLLEDYIYLKNFDVRSSFDSCIPLDRNWELSVAAFSTGVVTCAICSMWILRLKERNYRLMTQRLQLSTLTARYQQTANSNSAASIAPSLVGFFFVCVLGTVCGAARGLTLTYMGLPENNVINRLLTDICYTIVDLYSLCHSICFLYYNDAVRVHVKRDLQRFLGSRCVQPVSTQPARVDPNVCTDEYFQQFKTAWD